LLFVTMRSFALLAAVLPLTQAIEPPRFPHQPLGNGTQRLTYNITTDAPGRLAASTRAFSWVSNGEDGDYIFTGNDGSFLFENVATGKSSTFLSADKVPADYYASHVLWAVNRTKEYRHSYYADYLVQNVETGESISLDPESNGTIQYAEWSPVSSSQIAFVKGNNLYLWNNGTVKQITENGGPDFFNGMFNHMT
jgi:hypothetical protein